MIFSDQNHSLPQPQPPHTTDELKFANRSLEKLVQDSRFFPLLDRDNRVQTIAESGLNCGAIIGKGGFCEVRCVGLKYPSCGDQGQGDPPKYAMKYLSPTKTRSSKVFQRGVADLAMEACFLSLLRHDNIIGLHYVSKGSLEENYNCVNNQIQSINDSCSNDEIYLDENGNLQLRRRPPPPSSRPHLFGYFLLLDPLHETLADRIENTYVSQALQCYPLTSSNSLSTSTPFHLWDKIRHKKNPQILAGKDYDPCAPFHLVQRLEIAKSIASALTYLHEDCRIIYRDVKPDNIGFLRRHHLLCSCGYRVNNNRDGCSCFEEITKLFDFGLAKELKPKYRKSHPAYPDLDTYKLTGCTGSRRYMAPEVCFSDPYNEKADVYSYGMLLYQMASLVTPFDGFSMGKHERYVLREGHRPDVKISAKSFLLGKQSPIPMQQEHTNLSVDVGLEEIEKKNKLLALRTIRYWPKDLPCLMEECWDGDMRHRPLMKEVLSRLQRCINDLLQERIGSSGIGPYHHTPKFNSYCAKEQNSYPSSTAAVYDPPSQQQHDGRFFPLTCSNDHSGTRNRKYDDNRMDIDTANNIRNEQDK